MRKILSFLIILSVTKAKSQINIVPNSGFETYSSCPTAPAQWNKCNGWNNINMNTGSGLFGTPDYLNTCGSSNVAPPNTFAGTCNPQAGNAMMALVLYNVPYPGYREYLSTQLTCSMQPGTTYTLSFWLSNGINPISPWTIKNIGVHFSSTPLSQSGYNVINVVPQCEVTNNVASTGWTQYTFAINPTSVWNYLSFGAFRPDASNNPTQSFPNMGGNPSVYANYFVDEIKVLAPSLTSSINLVTTNGSNPLCLGQAATITAMGASSYSWNTGSNSSSIIVSPTVNTVYWASSNSSDACGTSSAAITISVAPVPTITVDGPMELCAGQNVILTASGASSYNWSSGQLTASVAISPFFTTTYSVTGVNTFGCSNSTAFTVNVAICESIADQNSVFLVKAYPNPFNQFLTVELPNNIGFKTIQIVNMIGELVFTFNENDLLNKIDAKYLIIDTKDLPKGIYSINVEGTSGFIPRKLIKE